MVSNYGAVLVLPGDEVGRDEVVAATRRYWLERGASDPGDPFDGPTMPLSVGRLTVAVLPENSKGYIPIIDSNLSCGDRDLASHLAEALQVNAVWLEVGEKRRHARLVSYGDVHRPPEREPLNADGNFDEVLRLSHMELGSPGDVEVRELQADPRVVRGEIAVLAFHRIERDENRYYRGAEPQAIAAYEETRRTTETVVAAARDGNPSAVRAALEEWAAKPGHKLENALGIGQAPSPLATLADAFGRGKSQGRKLLVEIDDAAPGFRSIGFWYSTVAYARATEDCLSDGFIDACTNEEQVRALQGAAYTSRGEEASTHLLWAILNAPASDTAALVWAAKGLENWEGVRDETLQRLEMASTPELAEVSVPLAAGYASRGNAERAIEWIVWGLTWGVQLDDFREIAALGELLQKKPVLKALASLEDSPRSRLRERLATSAEAYGERMKTDESAPAPFVGAREGSRRLDWFVFLHRPLDVSEEHLKEAMKNASSKAFATCLSPKLVWISSRGSVPKKEQLELQQRLVRSLGDSMALVVNLNPAKSNLTNWGKRSEEGLGSSLVALALVLSTTRDETDPFVYEHTGAESGRIYWCNNRGRLPYRDRASSELPKRPSGAIAALAITQRLRKSQLKDLRDEQKQNLGMLILAAMGANRELDQELHVQHVRLLGSPPRSLLSVLYRRQLPADLAEDGGQAP